VWSSKDLFWERVLFDKDFWEEKKDAALRFHNKVVLPELLGNSNYTPR
jgi:hypothetical protein